MQADRVATGTVIELDRVGVQVDDVVLLEDVSLSLTAGRTAVIGSNGSGKSTFARLLNGLRTATTGSVRVHGLDPVRDAAAVRSRVGFVFTNPEAQILMPTAAEDLALSLRDLPRPERAARVADILAEHGLSHRADVPVAALSGGQRQLVAIAAVLATAPAMLVADEPTTLLDLRNARRIGEVLLNLDVPVVLVTHDLELAGRCDEAVLFEDGRVRSVGEPARVIDEYRRSCG